MDFEEFLVAIQKEGYITELSMSYDDTTRLCVFRGFGVMGAFAEPNDGSTYSTMNGKVAIENIEVFDKWSKAPVSLPYPSSKEEYEFVMNVCSFLGSNEGREWSNSYNFLTAYPEDLDFKKWKKSLVID